MEAGELEKRYSKLEVQRIQEEIDSFNLKYSGIKDLDGMPGVVFVSDVIVDANAVKEANKSQIPVIGIVDSNSNRQQLTM
jgi:small subunit ribosomal protein S2